MEFEKFLKDFEKFMQNMNLGASYKIEEGALEIFMIPGEKYDLVLNWIQNYNRYTIEEKEIIPGMEVK